MRLFDGIQIVSVESFGVLPAATSMMGEWGAEVIRVEPPTGDPLRQWTSDFEMEYSGGPWRIPFDAFNRNKRALGVDLRSNDGHQIFERLVNRADILLTNIRPKSREQLNLRWSLLQQWNPDLVFVTVTGYGEDGADANRPGPDYTSFWAASGIMSIMGEPGDPPVLCRPGIGDMTTSMAVVMAASAGLAHKLRTGRGIHLAVSQLHTALWVGLVPLQMQLFSEKPVRPLPRSSYKDPLMKAYGCRDGRAVYICVASPGTDSDELWGGFCTAVGRRDLITDPRFKCQADRIDHRATLDSLLSDLFQQRTLDEWAGVFASAQFDYWFPVLTLDEVAHHESVAQNRWIQWSSGGEPPLLHAPVSFPSGAFERIYSVGEVETDTTELMKSLGYSEKEIVRMKDNAIIAGKGQRTT